MLSVTPEKPWIMENKSIWSVHFRWCPPYWNITDSLLPNISNLSRVYGARLPTLRISLSLSGCCTSLTSSGHHMLETTGQWCHRGLTCWRLQVSDVIGASHTWDYRLVTLSGPHMLETICKWRQRGLTCRRRLMTSLWSHMMDTAGQ